jgi:hypothetical protein
MKENWCYEKSWNLLLRFRLVNKMTEKKIHNRSGCFTVDSYKTVGSVDCNSVFASNVFRGIVMLTLR